VAVSLAWQRDVFSKTCNIPKVFIVAPTHKLCSQIIHEIESSSSPEDLAGPDGSGLTVSTLGSLTKMCINDNVDSFALSGGVMDDVPSEGFLEGTGSIDDKEKGLPDLSDLCRPCPFNLRLGSFPPSKGKCLDVGNLVDLGKQLSTCPYYASRVIYADVIVIPSIYMLRQYLMPPGMSSALEGSVIIFDEGTSIFSTFNQSILTRIQAHKLADQCHKLRSSKTSVMSMEAISQRVLTDFKDDEELTRLGEFFRDLASWARAREPLTKKNWKPW
jgi:Rad3-related DNA helicase